MMSCTRLYEDSAESLTGQVRKKKILKFIKQQWDIIRVHSSCFIITTIKNNNPDFVE